MNNQKLSSTMMEGGLPDFIPARMLNEFTYCNRLFYLEWVQGEFAESADTLEGRFRHRRVDQEKGDLPDSADNEDLPVEVVQARSVLISSEKYRLIARIDLLEIESNKVVPVDYKRGSMPELPEGAWEPDRVQLCAQALILKDHGYKCDHGIIYYAESKKRIEISIDEKLIKRTLTLRDELIDTALGGIIPEPLKDSPKCPRCSLVGICLPDETNLLYEEDRKKEDNRRLIPARQDALPVYIQEQGVFIGKKGDLLVIKSKGEVLKEVRLLDVSQLCIFGNVQVSTQALRELNIRNIPVCYFSYGGWFYGYNTGMSHKNIELRIRQFEVAGDQELSLKLAKTFVNTKIKNCRTFYRRNHPCPDKKIIDELSRLASKVKYVKSFDVLLGLEGAAAKVYFSNFGELIKSEDYKEDADFIFKARNRRPPTDPVNALLSYVYSLLSKDLMVTLLAVGFDPYLGFYHRPRYGRPALALDLMEEFRQIIGDSVVLTAINNREIIGEDFIFRAGSVALNGEGRKRFIAAYERRMDTLVTHPVFGYSVSYKRVLELQARLLWRYLNGEIKTYPAFLAR